MKKPRVSYRLRMTRTRTRTVRTRTNNRVANQEALAIQANERVRQRLAQREARAERKRLERAARQFARAEAKAVRAETRRLIREAAKAARALKKAQRQSAKDRNAEPNRRGRHRGQRNESKRRPGVGRGRKKGTRVTYTAAQTARYRSFFLRKQRAMRLPPPTKQGTAYFFKAFRRGHPPYRTTAIADQTGLSTEVQTASFEIIQTGNPVTNWDFAKLQFRWVAITSSSPSSGLLGFPFSNALSPRDPSKDRQVRSYRAVQFVFAARQYQSFLPDSFPQPSIDDLRGSLATGTSFSVEFETSPIYAYPLEQIGLVDGFNVFYTSYRIVKNGGFWDWIDYSIGYSAGPIYTVLDTGIYPTTPPLPGWFYLPSSAGGPSTAGIRWQSNTVAIADNLDILLSLAYSVRKNAGGSSYIRVYRNGVSFAELTVADYRKGAQFQDRPVTLLGGADYRFEIYLDPASEIEAAIARLGGDSFVCNCPDWNRKSVSFPSRFPSELQDRDWSSSGAGARGDCKHIMRVKINNRIPLIQDRPDDLDAIRQWRRDRKNDAATARRLQRQREISQRRAAREQMRQDQRRKRAEEREYQRRVRAKYDHRYHVSRAKRLAAKSRRQGSDSY